MIFQSIRRFLRRRHAASLVRKLQLQEEPLGERINQLLSLGCHDEVREVLVPRFGSGYEEVLKALILIDNRSWDALKGSGVASIDALLHYGQHRVLAEPD